MFVKASLGGTLNLASPNVNVAATMNADNAFKAEATSGAGSDGAGFAGSLAINSVNTSVRAVIDSGATVNLNGGALDLVATSNGRRERGRCHAEAGRCYRCQTGHRGVGRVESRA